MGASLAKPAGDGGDDGGGAATNDARRRAASRDGDDDDDDDDAAAAAADESAPSSSSSSSSSSSRAAAARPPPSNRLGADDVVVIAGGGIAGLALAAALQSSRAKVIVLERDPSAAARRQGYGVTLSETNAALRGLGILDDLRARNTRSRAHWTFKSDGDVLGYYGAAFLPRERAGPSPVTNLRVPRNDVREILLRRLRPGTVRFGERAVDYAERGDGGVDVVVESVAAPTRDGGGEGGGGGEVDKVGGGAGRLRDDDARLRADRKTETIRATLLVAADGVRSAIQRRRLGPNDELNYLGVVLITGFTTCDHALLRGQGFYTLDGRRARMFTMPFKPPTESSSATDADGDASSSSPGATTWKNMWQISVRVTEEEARAIAAAPRTHPTAGAKAFVEALTASWHAPVQDMLAHTDWDDVWAGPLYDRDRPSPPRARGAKPSSRVVAIGDAAHPMSPFKGMGANSALFDAWGLSSWLARAPIPSAIASFEREMITRAWAKVDASRAACEVFHGPEALRAAPEFAGVDPAAAATFLRALKANDVNAASGEALESETRRVMLEIVMREDGVKPYVYQKKNDRGNDAAAGDAAKEEEGEEEDRGRARTPPPLEPPLEPSSSSSSSSSAAGGGGGVESPELADVVEAAIVSALASLSLPPIDPDASDEREAARAIHAASKYSKGTKRPAHDFISRAALKLTHGRRTVNRHHQDNAPDRAPAPDAGVLARAIADALNARAFDVNDDAARGAIAAARASPSADGVLFITTRARDDDMRRKGLAMCAGCGQYYAMHGGGLRQHWARGGTTQACAAAAEAARSASLTDEEAAAKIGRGGVFGGGVRDGGGKKTSGNGAFSRGSTNAESSSWRGSGAGRPAPWREKKNNEETLCAGLAAAAAGDVDGLVAAEKNAGAGFDPRETVDAYGSGALHWAAGGGHLRACEWLVDARGVSVTRSLRKDGRTPLHWAARNGRLETCRWLLQARSISHWSPYDPVREVDADP